ncbi:MAG TPA: HAMP domain-containing sensor histidine kinase [Kofleriaceae bacterium]
MPDNQKASGRDVTDQSLGEERRKTDDELARRRADIEHDADAAVANARVKADDTVRATREAADQRSPETAEGSGRLAAERHRADDLLAREREVADRQRNIERADRHRVIAALLETERQSTDASLLSERRSADSAITARDDFLGMVSHDLRTLLAGIGLNAAMLMHEAPPDNAGQRVVQRADAIQRFTTRMTRLIGDLLDVTSIEAGQLGLVVAKLDACRLLTETLDAFQPVAIARGIALTVDMAGDALLARFDQERILQVLANLVGNAIKFTEREGRIEIAVQRQGDEVLFSVRDTGPGIAHKHLAAIFDRFWQAPTTTRRGLGLGLYISKCIIESHGGRIWAESELGRGSVFHFTLPSASSAS